MAGPAYRSPWGKQVGGATKPLAPDLGGGGKESFVAPWFGGAGKPEPVELVPRGDRSPLFFWGGGATKPPSRGILTGARSMLAFWMGGAHWHYVPSRERELIVGEGGMPFERKRPIVDDDEIIEFLQLWTLWSGEE